MENLRENPAGGRPARRRGRTALALLSPLAAVFFSQLLTLQSLPAALAWMGGRPAAAGLTWGVLLLAEGLICALSDSLLCAQLLTLLPGVLLSLVSHLKQLANGAPLLIGDLAMAGQAGQVAGFLRPGMSLGAGTWGALGGTVLFLLAGFFCSRPAAPTPGWVRLRRGGGLLLALALALALAPGVCDALLEGAQKESQQDRNDRLGVLAGLYSAAVSPAMERPAAYSQQRMEQILEELEGSAAPAAESGVKPDVVLLLSESFFDPTRLPGVEFDADPIPNFRALAREFPTGTFLSNTYAGGTGNVEMELFTAIPSAFLGAGESLTTLSDAGAYARLPTLPRAFAGQGYETIFVHSSNDSLYNRARNIPAVGFDQVVFQEDFLTPWAMEGGYVSDDTLTSEILARLDQAEGPVFLYAMSMENHQPYFAGKFDDPSPVSFTAPALNREGREALDALTCGLNRADAALGRLVEALSARERPTILVFAGDHLPGMSLADGSTVYTALGCSSTPDTALWEPEELKRMHSTDFLVWNNYGAQLEPAREVSCTGLGAALLDWAGLSKPLYYHWVSAATEEMTLYRPRLFVAADGTAYGQPPARCGQTVADYRSIVYDLLYGQQYIAAALAAPPE